MPRVKRRRPYDPAIAHDRRSRDLLRNAEVATVAIDNPLALEPGEKIVALRSIRNDPLGRLHSHRQIDEAQYQAGRTFQSDWEKAERGPRAVDPTREFVDGGQGREPITEGQRKAVLRLNRAERELGADGSALVHDVLVRGMTMEQVDAVREILLLAVAAHIVERKYGDCRPVGQLQRRMRPLFLHGGSGHGFRLAGRVHGADEANPLARDGTDEALLLAVIADRASRGVDPAVECRVRDNPSTPHQRNQVVPGDDAIAIFQQMNQQVEHLRLHRDQMAVTAQLTTIGVEDVVVEVEFHLPHRIFSQETIKFPS